MTTNVISIEPFTAEYPVNILGKGIQWFPCTVVGMSYEGRHAAAEFIIMSEGEDGLLYPGSADRVQRVETR